MSSQQFEAKMRELALSPDLWGQSLRDAIRWQVNKFMVQRWLKLDS